MKKTIYTGLILLLSTALFSCGEKDKTSSDEVKLKIVTTTTMIADAVENIAGDKVNLYPPLCGPGVDPHSYSTTTRDIKSMSEADIIFYNGLRLEDQMENILKKMKEKSIPAAEAIPESKLLHWESGGHKIGYDPHVWGNPVLWLDVVDRIASVLAEKDTKNKEFYMNNADAYKSKIKETDSFAKEQTALIPEKQRVLITSHDAFHYFADYYGLKSKSILGISTQNEAGVQDIQNLAEFIAEKNIKTIFTETTVNKKTMKALQEAVSARGGKVNISETSLFSDSFGTEAPANTYLGMIRHNVSAVAEGLK